MDVVPNLSAKPLIIQSVALRNPRGEALSHPAVLSLTGRSSVGTYAQFPPPAGELKGNGISSDWARRQHVPGATFTSKDTELNVVFELRLVGGNNGSSDGLLIDYRTGGRSYSVATYLGYRLVHAPRCVPTSEPDPSS